MVNWGFSSLLTRNDIIASKRRELQGHRHRRTEDGVSVSAIRYTGNDVQRHPQLANDRGSLALCRIR